jgi:glutamate dehydrogenase
MVARLFDLDGAIGLARLAQDSGGDITAITCAFAALGERLGLDWAQMAAARMSPSDPWERLLVNGLARDFQQIRLIFLRRMMADGPNPAQPIDQWMHDHAAAIAQFRSVIARARMAAPLTPAMLAQIASQARNLLTR